MSAHEPRIDARAVAALDEVKVNGRSPTTKAVNYWMLHGCRGIRLESELRAGRRVTTVSAVRTFLGAINTAAASPSVA